MIHSGDSIPQHLKELTKEELIDYIESCDIRASTMRYSDVLLKRLDRRIEKNEKAMDRNDDLWRIDTLKREALCKKRDAATNRRDFKAALEYSNQVENIDKKIDKRIKKRGELQEKIENDYEEQTKICMS